MMALAEIEIAPPKRRARRGLQAFAALAQPGGAQGGAALGRAVPAEETEAQTSPLAGKRVLAVDDNEINLVVLDAMLQRFDCEIETAANGALAVERYLAAPHDLVLMDLAMPVMDGIDATASIRAAEAERGLSPATIIAITAHTLDDHRRAAMEAGMDDFLCKPVRVGVLTEAIARIFEKRG